MKRFPALSITVILGLAVSVALPNISVYAREAPPGYSSLSIAQQAGNTSPTLSSPERGRQLNTPNVTFQWSSTQNASSYHIVVREGTDPGAVVQQANTPNNNITFRLFDDTYSWYVEAIDAAGNVISRSETWWFQVLDADTGPPEVTVTSPNGGEAILGGSVFTITWAAIDDLTSIPNLQINIYLSINGGASWGSIASNQSNNGAFSWQVPNINTTQALIRVTATDERGKTGLDKSDTVFTITATPAAPVELAAVAATATQVNLSWVHGGVNVTNFSIQRSMDNFTSINATFTAPADARTFSDTTVTASTTFFFRVLAVNGAVSSVPSNVASVATPGVTTPAPPTPPQLIVGGGGGGGGGANTSVPGNTVGTTGLTGDVELKVDNSGKSQNRVRLSSSGPGKPSLEIPTGTTMKTKEGAPLSSITLSIPGTVPPVSPQAAIVVAQDFGPNGVTFDPPITLTMTFDTASLPPGVKPSDLTLGFFDGTQWVTLDTTLDAAANTLSARVSHFTVFAVMAVAPAPTATPVPAPPTIVPKPPPTPTPPTIITEPKPEPIPTPSPAPQPSSLPPGANWVLISGLILGVVAVIGIVSLVVMRRRED